MTRNPYENIEGLYFQTSGTLSETRGSIAAAMRIVRNYITTGGDSQDVRDALEYIQSESMKTGPIIKELNIYLFSDDLMDSDHNKIHCKRLYNNLVRRLK